MGNANNAQLKQQSSQYTAVNYKEKRKIHIQYGKMLFDVELTLNDPLKHFQKVVQEKTGVPPEKQKIVYRGKLLTKQTNLLTLPIEDDEKILIVGQTEHKDLISFQ